MTDHSEQIGRGLEGIYVRKRVEAGVTRFEVSEQRPRRYGMPRDYEVVGTFDTAKEALAMADEMVLGGLVAAGHDERAAMRMIQAQRSLGLEGFMRSADD